MKAIVIDLKNGFAAAFSDDGSIVKLKNKNYTIGQVIEVKEQSFVQANKRKKWFTSALCAAALICVLGTGVWAYSTPYSYVSLDVNPSVEYSVNRFQRVLTVNAVNDDGQEIIDEIDIEKLKNISIDDAIKSTVLQIAENGYFAEDEEGGIVITTSGENAEDAQQLADQLQEQVEEAVEETVEETEKDKEITVEAISVGLERVQEARTLGVTPGKLNLVEKLQASTGDAEAINTEEWLNKPVKDIMKAIKENKKSAKNQLKNEKPDSEEEDSEELDQSEEDETTDTSSSESSKEEQAQVKTKQNTAKAEQNALKEQAKAEEKAQKNTEKQESTSSKAAEKEQAAYEKELEKEAAASSRAAEKEAAASERASEKEERESSKSTEKDSGKSSNKSSDKSNNGNSGSNKNSNH